MSELSPKSRTLLDAARAARPPAAARDRMSAALAAQLGVAVIGAPPAPPPVAAPPVAPTPLASVAAAGAMAKAVVIGAVLGVLTVGGAAVWPTASLPLSRTTEASPSSLARAVENVAPSPIVEAAPASTFAAIAPPLPDPPRAAAPLAPRPRAASSTAIEVVAANDAPSSPPKAISIGEETALLREAQRSLKQGDGARAMAVLDDLAARHPAGVLREERLAARVFALCAEGKTDQAREAARRFLAEMPTSVQADRVRASCAASPGEHR
jgi:outer membrane lipoprotein YfiO